MLRKSELPHISIVDMELRDGGLDRLLLRQFPVRVRRFLEVEVKLWESAPWVAVIIFERSIYHGYVEWDERESASAPLLPITKRFENVLVDYAVIDPELITYVLIRL